MNASTTGGPTRGLAAWVAGWRLALRVARREALRARGRSVLVLVMIALPVLGVTAADVLLKTQDVSSAESLDRRLGAAEARVVVQDGVGKVLQGADPDAGTATWDDPGHRGPLTVAQVQDALPGHPLLPVGDGQVAVRTRLGVDVATAQEVDLASPLARGLYRLTSGRLPTRPGEVAVNAALAADGYVVGDRLRLSRGRVDDPTVVGTVESATTRSVPTVVGAPGSLRLDTHGTRTWLVGGAPVTWGEVRGLNLRGATVLSRAVVLDPPPLPPQLQQYADQQRSQVLAVVVLVVVMALIEVVLLAGPAFAVGARRQARSLALLAATGGTPAQARRVVLGSAVVLGGVAAALGVTAGIVAGRLLVPVLQQRSGTWFGPFEVPWSQVAGIAAFGLLSALLAAVVPAWVVSRQDVVAVLAGRRGDRRPSLRSPLVGVLLLAAGVASAAYGAQGAGGTGRGEYFIAGSALLAVLGMLLLVPVVLVLVARVAGRLPLVLRYAARDAARYRSRTVPAVAAVAATVAGVVALGIAVSSDDAQRAATYRPVLAMGAGRVTGELPGPAWARVAEAVRAAVPTATVTTVRGIAAPPGGYVDVQVRDGVQPLLGSWGSALGTSVPVAGTLPTGLPSISADDRRRATRALAAGGLVAFSDTARPDGQVVLVVRRHAATGEPVGRPARLRVPAVVVHVPPDGSGPQAVLAPALASRLALPVAPVALMLDGDVSARQQDAADQRIAAVSRQATLYVERGYVTADSTRIVQWVLLALGAVLMLGGTLTATFLALSDARPDLATLSAVGASPGTRRGVAAAYALVVGVVGALLGVGVGFIPGVAVTYPLTGHGWVPGGGTGPSHYLDVPWTTVGLLVVALPLLTALVVGVLVRARLPLVARLD